MNLAPHSLHTLARHPMAMFLFGILLSGCGGGGGGSDGGGGGTTPPASGTAPTVNLTPSPMSVVSGGSTTLTWTSTNATSCVASGGWTGNKGTNGNMTIGSITAATAFTLTCNGAGGAGSATANVTVMQAVGSYQTDFSLAENPISEGGQWSRMTSDGFTNVRTANGTAFGTNGITDTFDDSYALLKGFGPNQTAEAVVQRTDPLTNVTHEVQLLLRFTDDAVTARGYECLFNSGGNVQIFRWDGLNLGSMQFTQIGQPAANAPNSPLRTGDVVRASIAGNNISVFINGTLTATASDATYPTGQPGIGFFIRPGGDSSRLALTSYKVTSN
jgi:hypothetical protein